MSLSKRTFGLLALCALALSAFMAQNAAATTNGTTAFTCKETGSGGFTKAHCKAADAGAGKFSHVEFVEGATTEITGSNEKTGSETSSKTSAVIKTSSTPVGGFYTFEASGVSATGSLTNKMVAGEHVAEGALTLTFTGVTVTSPAGTGCKVKNGKIETAPLSFTTAGQGMEVKFVPAEGTKFLEFTVEGCSISALNTKGTVVGSIKGTLDGATLDFSMTGTTEQATLIAQGSMAVGLGASIALVSKSVEDKAFTPLSFTTVET